MSAKPTAATVHSELVRHETECSERWKQAFKHFDKIDNHLSKLQWWIVGSLTTFIIALLGAITTILIKTI